MMRSVFIIILASIAFVHGWAGKIHWESPTDPKVEELLDFAFQRMEMGSNSLYARQILNVVNVSSQLVAGKLYNMKIHLGQTNCTKHSPSNDLPCRLSSDEVEECDLKIWTKVWENFTKLSEVKCTNYHEETVTTQKPLLSDAKSVRHLHLLQSKSNFKRFVKKYGRSYANIDEYDSRYQIFRENMKRVQFLMETEQGTATYGPTEFSDLTEEEFRQTKLGVDPNLRKDDVHWPTADVPDVPVPEEFDWREKGAVTPVKNQGSCGSCWAFSVTGNVEALWFLKSNNLVVLSEQEMVDCDKLDNGCNGGLPENAYEFIVEEGGLESESDYPYEGKNDKCHLSKKKAKVDIDRAVEIPTNETQIAQWLITHGPISIGLNANAMQFYMGGVSHPFPFLCSPKSLDHGVLIVGFGVHNYTLFHTTLPYWIIKNSWGPSWGEQGYYRLYRGDGSCGVNQMATSAMLN